MGKETFDLFLVLTRNDNDRVIGESRDAVMSREGAIEIDDFSFDLDKASVEDEEKATKGSHQKVDLTRITDEKQRSIARSFFEGADERIATLQQLLKKDKDATRKKIGRERTFSIKKDVDRSSAALFRAYCEGLALSAARAGNQPGGGKPGGDGSTPVRKRGVFSKAVVYVRKAGGDQDNVYLKFEFEELNVIHYGLDVSETEHDEKVGFSFDKVTVTYRDQQETGQLKAVETDRVAFLDFTKDAKAE
jgi:type VI protein secretion system component Hcp